MKRQKLFVQILIITEVRSLICVPFGEQLSGHGTLQFFSRVAQYLRGGQEKKKSCEGIRCFHILSRSKAWCYFDFYIGPSIYNQTIFWFSTWSQSGSTVKVRRLQSGMIEFVSKFLFKRDQLERSLTEGPLTRL